jgi:hypothetical protein
MNKYNRHKNWNRWNVSAWVNNDEGLYRQARHCPARGDAAEMPLEPAGQPRPADDTGRRTVQRVHHPRGDGRHVTRNN